MNPASLRPFPISVVAMGPGSQGEEAPDYLAMPKGMETFSAPRLPENVPAAVLATAARVFATFVDAAEREGFGGETSLDLLVQSAAVRDVIGQSLGFGEVSAYTTAPQHWRVQESAFAGFWRVLLIGEDGRCLSDRLETAPIPACLIDTMHATTVTELPAPSYPEGIMNAQALVEEIRQQAAGYRPGEKAHVINLTLLPVSEADLDTLYGWLGHREVSILSRGYGNCRVTSTHLRNVWWVQYFNSMDTLILNSIEIVDMPDAALASDEDFVDSLARLREYIDSLADES